MSQVVSIKWVTVSGNTQPEYVDVTLANGKVLRYRFEGSQF